MHVSLVWPDLFVTCAIGIIFSNSTATADQTVSLQMGTQGSLPCETGETLDFVIWKRGPTLSAANILVELDLTGTAPKRSGSGYDEGSLSISDDYSLIIYSVEIDTEGRYFCEKLNTEGIVTTAEILVITYGKSNSWNNYETQIMLQLWTTMIDNLYTWWSCTFHICP